LDLEGSLDREWEIVTEGISEWELERLKALHKRVQDCGDHPACRQRPLHRQPQTLLRFLRGRDGNVEKAEEMFRNSMEWRAQFNVDEKVANWQLELEEGQTLRSRLFHKYSTDANICLDKFGVPVWLMRMSVSDPKGLLREVGRDILLVNSLAKMEAMHAHLRLQMFKIGKLIRGCIQIMDVGDYGKHGVPHWWSRMFDGYHVGKEAFKIFDANYPETTRRVFFIRMGRVTTSIYKMAQPLIPERTKLKMRVFGAKAALWKDELRAEVGDEAQLPAFLLGDGDDAFASAWPKGGLIPLGGELPSPSSAGAFLRKCRSGSGLLVRSGSKDQVVASSTSDPGAVRSVGATLVALLVLALAWAMVRGDGPFRSMMR